MLNILFDVINDHLTLLEDYMLGGYANKLGSISLSTGSVEYNDSPEGLEAQIRRRSWNGSQIRVRQWPRSRSAFSGEHSLFHEWSPDGFGSQHEWPDGGGHPVLP